MKQSKALREVGTALQELKLSMINNLDIESLEEFRRLISDCHKLELQAIELEALEEVKGGGHD